MGKFKIRKKHGMTKDFTFYAFRYLVSPTDPDRGAWLSPREKELVMRDCFAEFLREGELRRKEEWLGKRILKTSPSTAWAIKDAAFRPVKFFDKHIQGNANVLAFNANHLWLKGHIGSNDLCFVHFVSQIILIENHLWDSEGVKILRRIEKHLRPKLEECAYSCNIYPISNPEIFWGIVEQASNVYELAFTLNAPNMYEGEGNLTELLKRMKGETNHDSVEIVFRGEVGRLTVSQYWKYVVDRICKIGGLWRVRFKEKETGGIKNQTNTDNPSKIKISLPPKGDVDEKHMQDIEQKINKIDNLPKTDHDKA